MDKIGQYVSDRTFNNMTRATEADVVAQYLKEVRQKTVPIGAIIKRAKRQCEKEPVKEEPIKNTSKSQYLPIYRNCYSIPYDNKFLPSIPDAVSDGFYERSFSAWEYSEEKTNTNEKYLRLINNVSTAVREKYNREEIFQKASMAFNFQERADDLNGLYASLQEMLDRTSIYVIAQDELKLNGVIPGIERVCRMIGEANDDRKIASIGTNVSNYMKRILRMKRGIEFALDYFEQSAAVFPSNATEQEFWPEKIRHVINRDNVRKYGDDYLGHMKEIISFIFPWFSESIKHEKRKSRLPVGK
ncbi:MAG: hypothetical protein HZB65_02430 [Candidatus Aenigmarchaeota archaeon]|nr:hypothetical protein [Candidatus Aenigmarchaeota archaeon]